MGLCLTWAEEITEIQWIDVREKNTRNHVIHPQNQKKREQDAVGVHCLICCFKTVITLKLKLQIKLCSCPLESIYCLKKCPGTISAEYARWLQHNYNIPIPANKCSIQNKHILLNKSNLPLGQCSVFLQGQYPNKIWSIPWKVAPCPLKECSVHFQMSNPPFKGAVPLSEKSIFLHNICSIIDIEHPFQKCNMLETVSSTKECSFASYHDTPPSRVQSCFFFCFCFLVF